MRKLRLHLEDGYTMVSVVLTMMILGVFTVGAWGAINNDLPLVRGDTDRKRAYEAAEAGIQWYLSVLWRDPGHWTACATDGTQGVNMAGPNGAPNRSSWRPVDPDSETDEEFAIELVPAPNKTCDPNGDPGQAMLQDGVLRIRSTGRAGGKQRQVVATLRRKGFLDFIYFTQWETLPPELAKYESDSLTAEWVRANCDAPRNQRPSQCPDIQFAPNDAVAGPLHTEDSSLLICNSPTFGRNGDDAVEITRGAQNNWTVAAGGCSNNPNLKGTLSAPAGSMVVPENNRALKAVADIVVEGLTCLRFNGLQVTIYRNQSWSGKITCTGTPEVRSLSKSSVIYVDNDPSKGCVQNYDWKQDYNHPKECGYVAVQGNYSGNVTVASAQDVIVDGNLTRNSNSLLFGLIGQRFVRVYHPVQNRSGKNCTNQNYTKVTRIDAAILATRGSFLVDNFYCGASLGTLQVNGAIAQYWRGPVGTSANTGYIKDYNYNDRLRYNEPPHFLEPTGSDWKLLRASEKSPVQ
jgi:hypothetical protein